MTIFDKQKKQKKMETKFTKGQWYAKGSLIYCGEKAIGSAFYVRDTDETRLNGESWLDMMNRTAKQREIDTKIEPSANAKLMAAAPELFDACVYALKTFYTIGCTEDAEIVRVLEKVINKAND